MDTWIAISNTLLDAGKMLGTGTINLLGMIIFFAVLGAVHGLVSSVWRGIKSW